VRYRSWELGAEFRGAGGNPTQQIDKQPESPDFDRTLRRFYLLFGCVLYARFRIRAKSAPMLGQLAQILRSQMQAPQDDK